MLVPESLEYEAHPPAHFTRRFYKMAFHKLLEAENDTARLQTRTICIPRRKEYVRSAGTNREVRNFPKETSVRSA